MKLSTLLLLYSRGKISRRMFLLLRIRMKRRKKTPQDEEHEEWAEEQFDIANYSSKECRRLFRFTKPEILRLSQALGIPKEVYTKDRDRGSDSEAICIVLRRLAYPNRWIELRRIFGRSHSSLHRIFYRTLRIIDRRSTILSSWNSSCLDEESFEAYADAVSSKGGIIRNVIGSIDGTARPISRPKFHQKDMYSGHKRIHCTKWQGVMLPNGLFGNLYGGERGTMHDSRLLTESGFMESFQAHQEDFDEKYAIYGDSGYGKRANLHKPFSAAEVSKDPEKRYTNKMMSSVRQCVEWGFKEVVTKLAFIDFKKQKKMYEKPCNTLFRVAVLLTNCHNCLRPNQISQYFDLEPPSLEEYLQDSD